MHQAFRLESLKSGPSHCYNNQIPHYLRKALPDAIATCDSISLVRIASAVFGRTYLFILYNNTRLRYNQTFLVRRDAVNWTAVKE
jgi:hypothetical protein